MKKTAKKKDDAYTNRHHPSLSAIATRRFALSPSIIRQPPKINESLRLNYLYQRSSSMSNGFVALPKLILQNPNLTPDSIVLYCHLLHFDRNGSKHGCIARRETLSKFSNLSLHRIRRGLATLEDEGIITVTRRRNGLSDRIRINKECRPKINEPKKVQAPKKHLSTPRAGADLSGTDELKPSNTQEIKDFNVSTIKNNKITQVKEIETTRTDLKGSVEEMKGPTDYYLRRCSLERRRQIKKSIRPQPFNEWFSNSWVVHEDLERIKLAIPANDYAADFVNQIYANKLHQITGKSVEIVGKSALISLKE